MLKRLFTISLLALALLTFAGAGALALPEVASAQVDIGLEEVGEATGLSDEDPRIVIARFIRIAISISGVLLLILIMYGGFVWMTAAGDPDKVIKAKRIITNAIIGIIIIAASFSITTFVINSIQDVFNAGESGDSGGSGGFGGLGGGSSATFSVSSFTPEGAVSTRNVKPLIVFSRFVDPESVSGSINITNAVTGVEIVGIYETTANGVTFTPTAPCPEPNEDRRCFDENTTFNVVVNTNLKSTQGTSLSCFRGCSSSFTSGDIVDTENPSVNIEAPDSGERVDINSLTLVQASITDDAGVSAAGFALDDTVFDLVGAAGDDLTNVLIQSTWDNTGFDGGESYKITVTARDFAGNEDADSSTIRVNPAHCSNRRQDTDLGETGLDCGGECGACASESCETNDQCSSGICLSGTCVDNPVILNISPTDGAPGTFVTISGEDFGRADGVITFVAEAGGTIPAQIPACSDGWSDTEIIVEVPLGAADGPITVTTAGDLVDTSANDLGPAVPDFDVNTVSRPALCKLSPTSGLAGDSTTVIGHGFGAPKGDSSIRFEADEVFLYNSWSDGTVNIEVPNLPAQPYNVVVVVGGLSSNSISYTVKSSVTGAGTGDDSGTAGDTGDTGGDSGTGDDSGTGGDAGGDAGDDSGTGDDAGGDAGDDQAVLNRPSINFVNPENGGIGQYITLTGSNFGNPAGAVWLVSQSTDYSAIASVDFPGQCSNDFWSDSEITVIIPEKYSNNESMEAVTHNLLVTRNDGQQSEPFIYQVTTEDPTPGICLISPSKGENGAEVIVYGASFGSSEGSLKFYNEVNVTQISSWSSSEVTLIVPEEATTGPVQLISAAAEVSNRLNFEVGSGLGAGEAVEEGSSVQAAYAWSFSTGTFPRTPSLIITCTDDQISGVPNIRFTDDICVNSNVYGEFSMAMLSSSIVDGQTIIIGECADSSCDSTEVVLGNISLFSSAGGTNFTWSPDPGYNGGVFKTNTRYQVTVTAGVLSKDQVPADKDVSWVFDVGSSDVSCRVEKVRVSPNNELLKAENEQSEFNAIPGTQDCQVLDADSYSWSWEINTSIASVAEGVCAATTSDSCAVVTAFVEGETDVTATEDDSQISGAGELIIQFSDPYVSNNWPACTEACTNGEIGASFNIPMNQIAIEAEGAVTLLECRNELCLTFAGTVTSATSCKLNDAGECKKIVFGSLPALKTGKFYRVIIKGDVISESGVELTRPNYGEDYSWIFRTKLENAECVIATLEIEPSSVVLSSIGAKQVFTLSARGNPDDCSVAGQRINTYNYDWTWDDPILDDANVSSWVKINGGLFDVNLDSIPNGCSASCLALGSEPRGAVCGNGNVEVGEDCDDGNAANGDGCSSTCLWEGTPVGAICGDGDITYGEECDDGPLEEGEVAVDGDGCSAICLREGSVSVDATCGNGDIAQLLGGGGEDCDDGNRRSGDGCSSQCLNEGSLSLGDSPAVCGDDKITRPYERCDVGLDNLFVDGDGCSSNCLRDGTGFTCGNGIQEHNLSTGAGEDCDGEEGCSDQCTWLGSSLEYSTPSVCGDGLQGDLPGIGELFICENGNSGNNRIDPIQVAQIDKSAALEVDLDLQLATSTIRVSSDKFAVTGEASLSLSCVAKADNDCADGFGPANNSCCMARTTGNLFPASNEACRNALIYGVFDQEMNTASFSDNFYIKVNTDDTAGICPDGYTTFREPLAKANQSWLARTWRRFISLFSQEVSAQVAGDCLLPIAGVTQRAIGGGFYEVAFRYTTVLAPNARHTIVAYGGAIGDIDENGLALKDGILSRSGVEIGSDITQNFTTGSELCVLDQVVVTDTDEDSPGIFRMPDETHNLMATAFSTRAAQIERLMPVSGVYEWDWLDWKEDAEGIIVEITAQSDQKESADFTAKGPIGEVHAVAQAQIIEGGESGDIVSGNLELEAIICQNPWPDFDNFPFIDNELHFSTFYCKDSGEEGIDGDYPGLTSVIPRETPSVDVLKEYLLKVGDGSGDAIGIRILSNHGYLSPMEWYFDSGFAGSPVATTVDGFEAAREGRTIYVAAPNVADSGTIYPNIYVISFNEGASARTVEIFNRIIDNFELATNLSVALCHDGRQYTSTQCSADWDCNMDAGETCGSNKLKIQRDMKRLSDIKNISSSIDNFVTENGFVPTLQSGTFVRARVSSSWSSWSDQLGSTIGASIPSDPLNGYGWTCGSYCENSKSACQSDGDCSAGEACLDSSFPGFDYDTCVNQDKATYVCTEGSYAYHYQAVGASRYVLSADLEYLDGDWAYDYDVSSFDAKKLVIGGNASNFPNGFSASPFCSNNILGESTVCGDGVVGAAEVCELGQRGDSVNAICDIDGVKTAGSIDRICNSACTAFIDDPSAVCVPITCGNGVIEGYEQCDDGSSNGRYGFCGNNCTYDSAWSCGDGSLAGGEVCDCGISSASGRALGGALCSVANGQYSANPFNTCSWDCKGPATYCGDGTVDAGEQCDGNIDSYAGKICSDGGTQNIGQPCETNEQCTGIGRGGFLTTQGVCGETTEDTFTEVNIIEVDIYKCVSLQPETCTGLGDDASCITGRLISDVTEAKCLEIADGEFSCGQVSLIDEVSCTDFSDSCLPIISKTGIEYQQDCAYTGREFITEESSSNQETTYNTCPATNVCIAGEVDEIGYSCNLDTDCGENGLCSTSPIQTTRTRGCNDDGTADQICNWSSSTWQNIDCKSSTNCGNGLVEEGEQCDDGNDDTNDECTNQCTTNVCGDGYLFLGTEDCDEGSNNGELCSVAYGSTCSYCSDQCRLLTTTGTWCGDGLKNGDEFCDAGDLTYYFYNPNNVDGETIGINGTCDSSQVGVTINDGTRDFTCTNVGVCNGATEITNGKFCTFDGQCGGSGGKCIFPTCANDCRSSCPFAYDTNSLQVKAGAQGASRTNSVKIFSTSNETPNINKKGLIYVPECSVSKGITLDIDFSFDPPEDSTYILYLLDTSNWINNARSDDLVISEFGTAKSSIKNGINSILNVAGEVVNIGLITVRKDMVLAYYGDPCLEYWTGPRSDECRIWREVDDGIRIESSHPDFCGGEIFCGEEYRSDLVYRVDLTQEGSNYNRVTAAGVREAITIFRDEVPDNAAKILILYTDALDENSTPTLWQEMITLKNNGVQVYTAAMTTNDDTRRAMELYSSGDTSGDYDVNPGSDIDYAHPNGGLPLLRAILLTGPPSVSDLSGIASEIIRSVGVLFTFDFIGDTITRFMNEGTGIQLPLPADFRCSETSENPVTVEASFIGNGSVTLNNFSMKMCKP